RHPPLLQRHPPLLQRHPPLHLRHPPLHLRHPPPRLRHPPHRLQLFRRARPALVVMATPLTSTSHMVSTTARPRAAKSFQQQPTKRLLHQLPTLRSHLLPAQAPPLSWFHHHPLRITVLLLHPTITRLLHPTMTRLLHPTTILLQLPTTTLLRLPTMTMITPMLSTPLCKWLVMQ
ncbi:hypothetical protein GGI08_008605, partial [Coemansia sp. S2]